MHRTASAHLYDAATGERTTNAFWIQLLHTVAWPGADWATFVAGVHGSNMVCILATERAGKSGLDGATGREWKELLGQE